MWTPFSNVDPILPQVSLQTAGKLIPEKALAAAMSQITLPKKEKEKSKEKEKEKERGKDTKQVMSKSPHPIPYLRGKWRRRGHTAGV
jgi:23S rRNA G2069 N7-methylase RlmK/C1962 C5-methylase RlmI